MRSLAKIVVLSLVVMFSQTAVAQPTNKEAKKLLTEASEKFKSYNNVFLSFNYTFENTKVKPPVVQKEKGTIGIKGNNYRLKFMGIEQIRNGKKLYTILEDDEEVQITDYTEEEDEGMTPSSILNLYKKGYSYKVGKTYTKNGKTVQEVELRPIASEEIEKIVVVIEKTSKKIVSLKQWGTNGTTTTFVVTSFVPNKEVSGNYFKFNRKEYPGYYIAD